MIVKIVEANASHAEKILEILREEEREYLDSHRDIALLAVEIELANSWRAFTGFIDDEPVCMWGLKRNTILSNSVTVWLLPTKLIDEHPFVFIRHSQLIMRELLGEFSEINGLTLATNARSMRWLKWLGFHMVPCENPRYNYFEKRRP
jgi:hypothetical protein